MHAYASMLVFVDTVYHYSLQGKVETQNLASHKEVVLISEVIICMMNCAIPACETQNFASLLRGYAFIVIGLSHVYVGVGGTGDARFCVSTGLAPLLNIDGKSILL
jgi:hypothetical protein